MADVVSALEQLHLNLPPTLGTSQVKSVRKELKMHLLRMMKHPGSFTLHNLHARMKQLLIELGTTPSEIQKEMPGPNEIDAALKRRLAAATAARKLQQTESGTDEKPSRKKPHSSSLVQTAQPPIQKIRIQDWTLFNATRELFHKESEQLQLDIFQRILGNEKRAVQGGAGLAQQKLLIRLCTRFRSALTSELEATLLNYVIEKQKTRIDLALLHLAELYAQLMGYSTLVSPKSFNQLTNEEKKQRYDTYLCTLLSTLHERGEHKE
uniref:Symplekin/Pta1 N-terminal domain-containing protein n=1 Tax=Meloidogyne javanica TaxID=6303 RepID=A0A915LQI2_MELJA